MAPIRYSLGVASRCQYTFRHQRSRKDYDLNRSVGYLEQTTGEVKSDEKNGVHVFFDNPEATFIPYDVIRSYDRPLIMGDFTARMADPNVKSELDWQLYLLQRRYLDYQVNIGNK